MSIKKVQTAIDAVNSELLQLSARREELVRKVQALREGPGASDLEPGALALVVETNSEAARSIEAQMADMDAAEAALQQRRAQYEIDLHAEEGAAIVRDCAINRPLRHFCASRCEKIGVAVSTVLLL